jgi:cyclic pyranopterin monophosphate synthase
VAKKRARLSHLTSRGAARMVDVGAKAATRRTATATARVEVGREALALIASGGLPKGDAFAVARIAGISAAKRTAELIPLCHLLPIEAVEVELTPESPDTVLITATVRTTGKTGVEMEALTAASVAALALYDMCKAVNRGIRIGPIVLERKAGGGSGVYKRRRAGNHAAAD